MPMDLCFQAVQAGFMGESARAKRLHRENFSNVDASKKLLAFY
jgi:hypothetical protein